MKTLALFALILSGCCCVRVPVVCCVGGWDLIRGTNYLSQITEAEKAAADWETVATE